jgi:hypothetical protein
MIPIDGGRRATPIAPLALARGQAPAGEFQNALAKARAGEPADTGEGSSDGMWAGAFALAGGAAVADGPLPIGDAAAVLILGGAAVLSLAEMFGGEDEPSDEPSLGDAEPVDHGFFGERTGEHVLDEHRFGAGVAGKREFPAEWSDDDILDAVEDIANDPAAPRSVQVREVDGESQVRTVAKGSIDGIEIEVVIEQNGHIVTGYPTNTPVNPG